MANVFRGNSDDFDTCVARYKNALNTTQEAYQSYIKSLEDLRSDWTGKAFLIMSAKVAAMGSNIAKSFDQINKTISDLQQVKNEILTNESSMTTKANNLEVGNESPFNA